MWACPSREETQEGVNTIVIASDRVSSRRHPSRTSFDSGIYYDRRHVRIVSRSPQTGNRGLKETRCREHHESQGFAHDYDVGASRAHHCRTKSPSRMQKTTSEMSVFEFETTLLDLEAKLLQAASGVARITSQHKLESMHTLVLGDQENVDYAKTMQKQYPENTNAAGRNDCDMSNKMSNMTYNESYGSREIAGHNPNLLKPAELRQRENEIRGVDHQAGHATARSLSMIVEPQSDGMDRTVEAFERLQTSISQARLDILEDLLATPLICTPEVARETFENKQIPEVSLDASEMEGVPASCVTSRITKGMITMTTIPMSSTTVLGIEDFRMDRDDFDLERAQLRANLLGKLGLLESVSIEKLDEGNSGAFNDGIWIISDGTSPGLVLKLVPHFRLRATRKTDTEKYVDLQRMCPNIVTELSLAFPLRIFHLSGPGGFRNKDLIVMRQAAGLQLTQHLYHKFHAGQVAELLNIFKEFGKFMRTIHRVYRVGGKSMQHGDCQPSNVFYDEPSGLFTLVDVADFGFGPYLAQGGEDDIEHFIEGLDRLKQWYGQALTDGCAQEFRRGYHYD